jgi:hypothetical protein
VSRTDASTYLDVSATRRVPALTFVVELDVMPGATSEMSEVRVTRSGDMSWPSTTDRRRGCRVRGHRARRRVGLDPGGFAVALHVDEPAEAERVFAALADQGTVRLPIQETFWARRFGMLTDRFGIPWMVNCEQPSAGARTT